MPKKESPKLNRDKSRTNGPTSRNANSKGARRERAKSNISYENQDYKSIVMVPDNISIIEPEFTSKLNHLDSSGNNILDLYERIKERMIDRRPEIFPKFKYTSIRASLKLAWNYLTPSTRTTFSPFFDEDVTFQNMALDIDKYLSQPQVKETIIKKRPRRQREQGFQSFLIDEVQIFENLRFDEGKSQGRINHQINNLVGPANVIANISNNIKPDYMCGYPDPESTFPMFKYVKGQIPDKLLVKNPNAPNSGQTLFLPYLAMELKWKGVSESVVQRQLVRCLSILAERQAEFEELSGSATTTPIFGITGIERNFAIWTMIRYKDYDNKIHYDMCQLASYDLTSKDDLDGFYNAMNNIHNWVHAEREEHFAKCIGFINQSLGTAAIRGVWNHISKPSCNI